jgi:hypothetical protein
MERVRKVGVKEKVFDIMKSGKWLTLAYIRGCFYDTEKGSQSVDRWIRFLKIEYTIEKRKKENCLNTWEYRLLLSEGK